ncbi:KAP family P-loop NTPase fold protein [Lacrimispora sp.]|uniref:KAP family P-loop NTPase fold protein n=1 Tax=Lacrimispora sp. TaxID=2719234 RepID=UPI00289991A8|nr:KAP family NTPase [Lacrimispora sp.]
MFNTDKPINKISEDKLGRSSFAKQLANAIMQFKTKDNYAISLQGKWGCGKTSVLNMAVEEIKQLSQQVNETEKIIIVQFNPWNFTDTNQLINQFFLTLANALKFGNKEDQVKRVGAAIEKYSSALEYSEYIPIVGKYLKLLPKLSAAWGKSLKEKAENKQNDVSYRKKELEKVLRELDSRILVVIDDIDRLSNEQIRLIFQLVSAVAGLPNITYLLSFDNEIVARALGDVQHCDGKEYLEKIIQVPFDVPPLDISKVHNILFEKLNTLIELHNGMEFDKNHWSEVFNSCISPFITTLRDINRFYNALSFMYAAVKEEVDFIDIAGISCLRVFASPIFEWIRENKYSLVGGYTGGGITLNDVKKREAEILEQFSEVYPEAPQTMQNAVASLFPTFSNRISFSSVFKTPFEIHQAMRIASESKFDLYFTLSLDNIKISRKEIDESLLNMKENELRAYINTLHNRELFGDYLEEIKYNLSRIPENRIELILSVLVFRSGRILKGKTRLIGADLATISVYTISDILFRINDESNRYKIIADMLSNTDFLSFQFLLHLLHIIELTHGRIAETSYMQEQKLVSLEHLYELEKIFLERTKGFVEVTNLLDWKEARRASFMWKFAEEKTYTDYMNNILIDDTSVLKYIAIKANEWTSSDGLTGYTFNDKSYLDFISDEKIINIINNLRLKPLFWEMELRVIRTAAAYILLSLGKTEDDDINIVLINEKIDEWKKEFEKQNNLQ